jgi:hypothetical protein
MGVPTFIFVFVTQQVTSADKPPLAEGQLPVGMKPWSAKAHGCNVQFAIPLLIKR